MNVFNCENTPSCKRPLSYFRSWENKPYALKSCDHVLCYYCATSQTLTCCPRCNQKSDSIFCLNRPKPARQSFQFFEQPAQGLFQKEEKVGCAVVEEGMEKMSGLEGFVKERKAGKKVKERKRKRKDQVIEVIQELTSNLTDLEGKYEKTDEEEFLKGFISSLTQVTRKLEKVQEVESPNLKSGLGQGKITEKLVKTARMSKPLVPGKSVVEREGSALNVVNQPKLFKSKILNSNLQKFEHKNKDLETSIPERVRPYFSLDYKPSKSEISFAPEVYKKRHNFSTYFFPNSEKAEDEEGLKKVKMNAKKDLILEKLEKEKKRVSVQKSSQNAKIDPLKNCNLKNISKISKEKYFTHTSNNQKSKPDNSRVFKIETSENEFKLKNFFTRTDRLPMKSAFTTQLEPPVSFFRSTKNPTNFVSSMTSNRNWAPSKRSRKSVKFDNKFRYKKKNTGENNFFDFPRYSFFPKDKKSQFFSNYFLNEPFWYKNTVAEEKKMYNAADLNYSSNYIFSRPTKSRDCFCCYENYKWPLERESSEEYSDGDHKNVPLEGYHKFQIQTNFSRNKKRKNAFAAKNNHQISDMPNFMNRKLRKAKHRLNVVNTEEMQYPRSRHFKRPRPRFNISDNQLQLFLRKSAESGRAQCDENGRKISRLSESTFLILSNLKAMREESKAGLQKLNMKVDQIKKEFLKEKSAGDKTEIQNVANLDIQTAVNGVGGSNSANLNSTNGINGSNGMHGNNWTHWTYDVNGTKGAFGANDVGSDSKISSGESILNNNREVEDLEDLKHRLTRIQKKNLRAELKVPMSAPKSVVSAENALVEKTEIKKGELKEVDMSQEKAALNQEDWPGVVDLDTESESDFKIKAVNLESCRKKIEDIMRKQAPEVIKKKTCIFKLKEDLTEFKLENSKKSNFLEIDFNKIFAKNSKPKSESSEKKSVVIDLTEERVVQIRNSVEQDPVPKDPISKETEISKSNQKKLKLEAKLAKEFNFLEKYFSNRIQKTVDAPEDCLPTPAKKSGSLSAEFARKINKINKIIKISVPAKPKTMALFQNKEKLQEPQPKIEKKKVEFKEEQDRYSYLNHFQKLKEKDDLQWGGAKNRVLIRKICGADPKKRVFGEFLRFDDLKIAEKKDPLSISEDQSESESENEYEKMNFDEISDNAHNINKKMKMYCGVDIESDCKRDTRLIPKNLMSGLFEKLERGPIKTNFKKLHILKKLSNTGSHIPAQAFKLENFSKTLKKLDSDFVQPKTANCLDAFMNRIKTNQRYKLTPKIDRIEEKVKEEYSGMMPKTQSEEEGLLNNEHKDFFKLDFDLDFQKGEQIEAIEEAKLEDGNQRKETELKVKDSLIPEILKLKCETFKSFVEVVPREMEIVEFESDSAPKDKKSLTQKEMSFETSDLLNVWKLSANTEYLESGSIPQMFTQNQNQNKTTQTQIKRIAKGVFPVANLVDISSSLSSDLSSHMSSEYLSKSSSKWESLISDNKSKKKNPIKSRLAVKVQEAGNLMVDKSIEKMSSKDLFEYTPFLDPNTNWADMASGPNDKERATLYSEKNEVLSACSNETPVPKNFDEAFGGKFVLEPEEIVFTMQAPDSEEINISGQFGDEDMFKLKTEQNKIDQGIPKTQTLNFQKNIELLLKNVTGGLSSKSLIIESESDSGPSETISKVSSVILSVNNSTNTHEAIARPSEWLPIQVCFDKTKYDFSKMEKHYLKEEDNSKDQNEYLLSQICKSPQEELLKPFSHKHVKKAIFQYEDQKSESSLSLFDSRPSSVFEKNPDLKVELLKMSEVEYKAKEIPVKKNFDDFESNLDNRVEISNLIDRKLKDLSKASTKAVHFISDSIPKTTKPLPNRNFQYDLEFNRFDTLLNLKNYHNSDLNLDLKSEIPRERKPMKMPLYSTWKWEDKNLGAGSGGYEIEERPFSPVLKRWFESKDSDSDSEETDQNYFLETNQNQKDSVIGSSMMSGKMSLFTPKLYENEEASPCNEQLLCLSQVGFKGYHLLLGGLG